MRRVSRSLLAMAALSGISMPMRTDAQDARLRGIVTDTAGRPLSEVAVRVLSSRDALAGATRTDSSGAYSVSLRLGDTVRVSAQRIGFAPYDSRAVIVDRVNGTHDVVLHAAAQRLGEVVIRAATNRTAFAERRAAGIPHAYYADSALLATADKRSLTTLFDQLSRMGVSMRIPRRVRPRYHKSELALGNGGMREQLVGTDGCAVDAWVDGWWTRTADLASVVNAREVAGIEVYNLAALAPIPYRDLDPKACTVVLIWTHAGMEWTPTPGSDADD